MTVLSRLVNGRPWDSFDAYLFDIDGTLLHCTDAVHYFAFCESLHRVSGQEHTLEGVVAHGNTDVGILRDAFRIAGVDDGIWRPRLDELRRTMATFVTEREAELCIQALPRVSETLDYLNRKGAVLGIATGNLRDIGTLKLSRAGLLEKFDVFGWSDEHEYRSHVFQHAIELMRLTAGSDATICILGDTPADIVAARDNQLPIIALATGVYSRLQLLEQKPDLCLQSLEDLFVPWEQSRTEN